MQPKLTDWFPPEIKPVHIGVYSAEVWPLYGETFRYWNGEQFMCACISPEVAYEMRSTQTVSQQREIHWRGLAEKPE